MYSICLKCFPSFVTKCCCLCQSHKSSKVTCKLPFELLFIYSEATVLLIGMSSFTTDHIQTNFDLYTIYYFTKSSSCFVCFKNIPRRIHFFPHHLMSILLLWLTTFTLDTSVKREWNNMNGALVIIIHDWFWCSMAAAYRACWMSLGMMVTRLAWMVHKFASSNTPTR